MHSPIKLLVPTVLFMGELLIALLSTRFNGKIFILRGIDVNLA